MIERLNNIIDVIFPIEYPIVFFHAHPDDESFLSAGLLNELVVRGRKCLVVFGAAAIVDGEERTLVRQKEAHKACKVLGVQSILYLDFCEPKFLDKSIKPLMVQNADDVSESLYRILRENNILNPFILISYDKNGGYGNSDHRVIHAAGRNFLARHKDLVAFLYEVTINSDNIIEWLDSAKTRLELKSMPKLSYWSHDFGSTTAEISYQYNLTQEQFRLKRKALTAHQSQMSKDEFPLSLSDEDFIEVFGSEFLNVIK